MGLVVRISGMYGRENKINGIKSTKFLFFFRVLLLCIFGAVGRFFGVYGWGWWRF